MDPAKTLLFKLAQEFYDENDFHIFDDFTFEVTDEESLLIEQIKSEIATETAEGIFTEDGEVG